MGGFKTPEVEENVGCNLIPMIDIMFLLLLFFMLSADMTQRDLENVTLAAADQVKEEDKRREKWGRTTVNVYANTDDELNTKPREWRQDEKNWMVAVRGVVYRDWEVMKTQLEEEGKLDMSDTIDPVAKRRLSERAVQIRADKEAPFGIVQKIIEVAGRAGLYKVEIAAAKPPAEK
jgi:biopolymer transport protein ExbD